MNASLVVSREIRPACVTQNARKEMKCWRLLPNQELIVTIVFLLTAQPFVIVPQEMKSLIVIINNDFLH